jgi:hypothetical protein
VPGEYDVICIGLPWVKASAVFFLALCTSLHTVPRETPILCPASSCDNPSRSTSLEASNSATSIMTGSRFPAGFGVRLFTGETTPNVIGFGNLPLLPHLCLCRHMMLSVFSILQIYVVCATFIYFCALSHNCKTCISTKIEVKENATRK